MATITINGKKFQGSSISVIGDNVIIDGGIRFSCSEESKELVVKIEGDNVNIHSDRSVRVTGNVNGDVECNGSLTCGGSISGKSVQAGGSVNCDDISGAVRAGGSINCDSITTG